MKSQLMKLVESIPLSSGEIGRRIGADPSTISRMRAGERNEQRIRIVFALIDLAKEFTDKKETAA